MGTHPRVVADTTRGTDEAKPKGSSTTKYTHSPNHSKKINIPSSEMRPPLIFWNQFRGQVGICQRLHPLKGFKYMQLYFSFLLRLHLRHMEGSRLGVELELQLLAYTTATAMPDLSCICELHHRSWHQGILNPLSEVRNRTRILMDIM